MTNSNYFFRLSTIDDSLAISSLLEEAERPGLDSQERTSQGFVQGEMSLRAIEERFRIGFGAVVGVVREADSDVAEEILAVSFSRPSRPTKPSTISSPASPARSVSALSSTRTVSSAIGLWLSPTALRGRGSPAFFSTSLTTSSATGGSHELVSLVDNKNIASMSLHRKSGFRAFSEYDFGDSTYTVFVRGRTRPKRIVP